MMVTAQLEPSKASNEDRWGWVYAEERSDEFENMTEGKQHMRDRETSEA